MTREKWSPSQGGVCNNCGEPRFAHRGDDCPDDARIAALADRIERWHQRVDPAKRLKDHARRHVRSMRNWHGKGWCGHEDLERAESIYRLAAEQYEAMIELADLQARP